MWQPSADFSVLSSRSELLRSLREFFYTRSLHEVDVPVLGCNTVTDPFLDSVGCVLNNKRYFLQTSPEYLMKRLLAAGMGDIFYLGKSFREDEEGRCHNPEFTMLEWYRQGFDDRQLASEVIDLVRTLKPDVSVVEKTYSDIFLEYCGIEPITASVEELKYLAQKKCDIAWDDEEKSVWLDLLFSHIVEPSLPRGLVVVFDYPKEQAALARLANNKQGYLIARRFEVFFNGLELANGYWELCDAQEQRDRFEDNIIVRNKLNKTAVELDEKFMGALDHGLPDCAGVAMGVDRLLMCLLEKSHISDVQAFPINKV